MFAVVDISGKQYKVSQGDIVEIDRIEGEAEATVVFDRVLLVSNDKTTNVGNPTVAGCSIKAKILAQHKGDKIDVRRFKSKVRSRVRRGFRSSLTKIEIVSIDVTK